MNTRIEWAVRRDSDGVVIGQHPHMASEPTEWTEDDARDFCVRLPFTVVNRVVVTVTGEWTPA